jgi:hypothetical protein
MCISNQVATLDEAKAEFEARWKQWKAWAKMEAMPSLIAGLFLRRILMLPCSALSN